MIINNTNRNKMIGQIISNTHEGGTIQLLYNRKLDNGIQILGTVFIQLETKYDGIPTVLLWLEMTLFSKKAASYKIEKTFITQPKHMIF